MTDLDRASFDHILPPAPGSPDWDDVMSRCRAQARSRRRRLLALAAALLVLAGTASAVGAVRDFFLDQGFFGLNSERATPTAPESEEPVLEPAHKSTIAFVGDLRRKVPVGAVYVVNADGSGQRRLARDVWGESLAWSPDGRKLAFVKGFGVTPETLAAGNANGEIYVMNADGSDQRNLTRNPAFDALPVWSPDGRQIAFVRGFGPVELYVMNADGSGQRRLAYGTPPVWSPDGRRIAFLGGDPPGDLYVMNADGSGQQRLARDAWGAAWSPDGRKLAFRRDVFRDGVLRSAVYVINLDGSGELRLTPIRPQKDPGPPAWSPDGRKIVFEQGVRPTPRTSRFYVRTEVYVMNADGSGRRRLAYGTRPFWSPDGRKIAFRRNGPVIGGLYVMNPDGSGQHRLSRSAWGAAWLPAP